MVIKKQFTKEQKHMLIQCIIDCDLFGLSDKEGMKYVEEKTGRSISLTSYQRYKKRALNDNAANAWIDYFARIGFVDHYRKRMNEMETLQKNLKVLESPLIDSNDRKNVLTKYCCYYCNYSNNNESDVERHSVISHPGKIARPDPSLLELIKKNKPTINDIFELQTENSNNEQKILAKKIFSEPEMKQQKF